MWMASIVTTPAAGEPITVEAAKIFCRIDGDVLNSELEDHIAGARGSIESVTGTKLLTQTVRLTAGSFDDLEQLPIGPIAAITALKYRDRSGGLQTLDPDRYELVASGLVAAIAPIGAWPITGAFADAVQITAIAGYGGVDDVPAEIRTALKLRVRGLVDGAEVDVDHWLVNHRIWL